MAASGPSTSKHADEKAGQESTSTGVTETDIFRDTPVRYLGYANEVGESFRSQVPVSAVRFTYFVASSYVLADAYSKGMVASRRTWPDDSTRRTKVTHAVLDTLIWQGLASVAVPGITINRICFMTNYLLKQAATLPVPARRWVTTGVGLASIPFIIKPIDYSIDVFMEHTFRKWYHIGPLEEEIVHHTRTD